MSCLDLPGTGSHARPYHSLFLGQALSAQPRLAPTSKFPSPHYFSLKNKFLRVAYILIISTPNSSPQLLYLLLHPYPQLHVIFSNFNLIPIDSTLRCHTSGYWAIHWSVVNLPGATP